jgi:hypothetical protein
MTASSFVVRAEGYQGETMLPFPSTLSAWNTTTEQFTLLTEDDSPAFAIQRHNVRDGTLAKDYSLKICCA